MSKLGKFEDLTIFQMARNLCKDVYAITKQSEFKKDTRFVQQIHAAAGSIMDNIAEGFERDGNKEFVNFLDDISAVLAEKEQDIRSIEIPDEAAYPHTCHGRLILILRLYSHC